MLLQKASDVSSNKKLEHLILEVNQWTHQEYIAFEWARLCVYHACTVDLQVHKCESRIVLQVATNALLERQGERTALVVTEGFQDLLLIANQTRDSIFQLDIQRPDLLYEIVVQIEEDIIIPLTNTPSPRNGMSEASRCGT